MVELKALAGATTNALSLVPLPDEHSNCRRNGLSRCCGYLFEILERFHVTPNSLKRSLFTKHPVLYHQENLIEWRSCVKHLNQAALPWNALIEFVNRCDPVAGAPDNFPP